MSETFDISFATLMGEPVLYGLLTFHVPYKSHVYFPQLRSFIQRIRQRPRSFVTFHNKLIFTVRSFWPHAQPLSWRSTPCRLLRSISGGRLLHPQPEDGSCRGAHMRTLPESCAPLNLQAQRVLGVNQASLFCDPSELSRRLSQVLVVIIICA
jgi:hypothetical protein